ncbi:MAG: pyridoxamine 5'-phosphate oxidase [Bacteroidetes bacterium]|nr:pyridoxamine 5'-phosphate oxidase [Bacteroidota bacterium]
MNRDHSFQHMRQTYQQGALLEEAISKDPIVEFNLWMKAAIEDAIFEPNAMSLATVGSDSQPSCRIVLLKEVLEGKFIFYTNYSSKKGRQIKENGKVALLFWWIQHERQIRIEGSIKKVPRTTSEQYFQVRPLGSRIGAIASPQSQVIDNRAAINDLYKAAETQFVDGETKCPEHWGGYEVEPHLIEFWQGRENRLHDRIQYSLVNGEWKIDRLAP